MDVVTFWLKAAAAGIAGLAVPVILCKWACDLFGVARQSTAKVSVLVFAGLLIVTLIEIIARRYVALPGVLGLLIFCVTFLTVFALLWQLSVEVTPFQAMSLALVVLSVVLLFAVVVPADLNPYGLLRRLLAAAVRWVF